MRRTARISAPMPEAMLSGVGITITSGVMPASGGEAAARLWKLCHDGQVDFEAGLGKADKEECYAVDAALVSAGGLVRDGPSFSEGGVEAPRQRACAGDCGVSAE